MLHSLHLKNVGTAPEMRMDLAPRLNLITGDNGLGKSFVLELAWWALTRNGEPVPAMPRAERPGKVSARVEDGEGPPADILRNVPGGRWPLAAEVPSRPFNPGLTVYAKVDGGCHVWDLIRTRSAASYDFSQAAIWDGLEGADGRVLCNGLIRDWVSWQLRQSESFTRLCEVLEILSPDATEPLRPGEPTRVGLDDARDIPTLAMPYGLVPLTQASAGIRRVVGLGYLLVWAWEEHLRAAKMLGEKSTERIVLLIDEVEAHLHPRWQRLILPALLKVVQALRPDVKVQVIAVTHSPLVLASVEPLFDTDQDALFMFDLVGSEVKVSKADWRPRGDANAWLTSEVFDLKEARSVEAERAITEARAALKDPHLPIEEVKRIHNELYRLLKDTDPFWPRWLARAEAAGIDP